MMTRKPYITTRTKALDAGRKTYLGRPCPVDGSRQRETDTQLCVQCRKLGTRYYDRHRDVVRPKAAAYQKQKRAANREKALWYGAKKNAQAASREFTISVEDIVIPDICPVLGFPLDSSDRNHTPSVDRKDNSLGYIKENIRVISARANRLKSDASLSDLEALVGYMRSP